MGFFFTGTASSHFPEVLLTTGSDSGSGSAEVSSEEEAASSFIFSTNSTRSSCSTFSIFISFVGLTALEFTAELTTLAGWLGIGLSVFFFFRGGRFFLAGVLSSPSPLLFSSPRLSMLRRAKRDFAHF